MKLETAALVASAPMKYCEEWEFICSKVSHFYKMFYKTSSIFILFLQCGIFQSRLDVHLKLFKYLNSLEMLFYFIQK